MVRGLFHERTDWVAVLERLHARQADEAAWGAEVVEQYAACMARGGLAAMNVLHHDDDFKPVRVMQYTPSRWRADAQPLTQTTLDATPTELEAFYYPRASVCTSIETVESSDPSIREAMRHSCKQSGLGEGVTVNVHPAPNVAVVLWLSDEKAIHLRRGERATLARLAMHLESTYRLRLKPESVLATLSADGRMLERTEEGPTEDLSGHLTNIKRAKSKGARWTPEALDLWPALIEGRMSLVNTPRSDRYAVLANTSMSRPLRALTRAELDVLMHAIRGMSSKMIGYALGISTSAVSTRLQSAANKIGLFSRTELVRVAAMLVGHRNAQVADAELTAAEREILELLQRGLTNREIAKIRSRSVRTVANQVVALLRKTGATSRRSLAAHARSKSAEP